MGAISNAVLLVFVALAEGARVSFIHSGAAQGLPADANCSFGVIDGAHQRTVCSPGPANSDFGRKSGGFLTTWRDTVGPFCRTSGGLCDPGLTDVRKVQRFGRVLMYSRPFLLITCLTVLWLCFFAVAAEAQDSNKDPAPKRETIGSEVSYLRNQAARGDAMANDQLGHLYMTGTGVSLNYAEAAKFLHAAAEQGVTEAEFALGYLYEHGKGVPQDYRKAFAYYTTATRKGNLTATNNLGLLYEYGHGIRRDVRKAEYLFRYAAERGNPVAQCNLGTLNFGGRGITQNYPKAAEWFRKAAENGYAPGQQILAWMYFTGSGVPRDYAIGTQWLQLAAHGGDPRAQVDLGYLYEQGKGVPLDYVTAYMWYETAESGGERRASERLRKLSKVMTKEQISRAITSVRDLSTSTLKGEAVEQSQRIGNAFNPPH